MKLVYALVDPPGSEEGSVTSLFKIDPANGTIPTMETLDREASQDYQFYVEAVVKVRSRAVCPGKITGNGNA